MISVARRLLLTHRSSTTLILRLVKPTPDCVPKMSSPCSIPRKSPARLFSSPATGGQDDLFESFKCYTVLDPDTPYHVIEPLASTKAAPERANGCAALTESERPNVEHIVCETSDGDSRRCDVYLIGVGSDGMAARDVKKAISFFKPEVVFLELCERRRTFLALNKLQGSKAIQVQHNTLTVAFEEAKENGMKVVLGDRPFDVTVRRILESMLAMRIWEFTKLSVFLLFQFMEYGKDNKVFNINDFIRQKIMELKGFPSLLKPIVYERDVYMSSVLLKVAGENSKVIAVVGIDHIPGIKRQLKQRFEYESS